MSAVTFDTLKFVEILEAAKMPREHATAIAAAVRTTHDAADVATKADLADLRKDTDSKFDMLRRDMNAGFTLMNAKIEAMNAKIEAESSKIIIRIGGAVITVMLALEAINRFWPKVRA